MTAKARARPDPGAPAPERRAHAERDPRGGDPGVHRARPERRARRQHRGPHPDQQADDLLLLLKSKRQLFIAVLEDAYRRIREAERALRLDDLPPLIAMRLLIEFTCDYHWKHPEFAKLVAIENVQKGRNIARAPSITGLNTSIVDATARVLRRALTRACSARASTRWRLHMTISALPLFHITNRYTFGTIFRHDMASPEALAARRREIVRSSSGT